MDAEETEARAEFVEAIVSAYEARLISRIEARRALEGVGVVDEPLNREEP